MAYIDRPIPDNLEITVEKNGTAGKVVALDPAGFVDPSNNFKGATFKAYGSTDFYDAVVKGLYSQTLKCPSVTIIVSNQTVFSSLNLQFVYGDFNQDNESKTLTTSSGRSAMDQNTTVLTFNINRQLDIYTGLQFFLPANANVTFTFDIEEIIGRQT